MNGLRTGSKNMQLICLRSTDDNKEEPRFIDASCQVDQNHKHKSFIKVSQDLLRIKLYF